MSNSTKYFLYARKSTDAEDRQVYSIEHQLSELRQVAARKGLDVVAEFTENRTAKMGGRPKFNEMIARIKKGEASGILAWHPDRLSRNSIDGGHIMYLIDQNIITHLEFSVFWFEATPQGKLMLSIAFGMSKYYTDALSQNVKRAIRQRVQNGHWPGRPPIGYLFDRNSRTIVVDPDRAPKVRKVFELYATGEYTIERLPETMARLKFTTRSARQSSKPLPRSYYHRLLRNPFYVGVLRYEGECYEGKHESLISTKLFSTCQAILSQRGKARQSTFKPFLYRGMFKCGECACGITMEIQKGHTYLRCSKRNGKCSQRYLREEEISRQIENALAKVTLPKLTIQEMIQDIERKRKQEGSLWLTEVRDIKSRIAGFDIQLQRLTNVYVDGTLPLAEYREAKEKLLKQKHLWTEKLAHHETHRESWLEPFYDSDWVGIDDAWNVVYLRQGTRRDFISNIDDVRNRMYFVTLERWGQEEPSMGGYVDGMNLYLAFAGNPRSRVDPSGLQTWSLDKANNTLTLHITARANYSGSWTSTREAVFEAKAKAEIESAFNGTTYVIRQTQNGSVDPCGLRITPKVDIKFLPADQLFEDWALYIAANPSHDFMPSETNPGLNVSILDEGDVYLPDDRVVDQLTVVHEFGHFLGLDHPFLGMPGTSEYIGTGHADSQGREVSMYDLMGVGMKMRPFYFDKWAEEMTAETGQTFKVVDSADHTR